MSTVLNRHQAVARLRSVPSRRSIGEKKFHFFLKYPPSKSLERRSRLNPFCACPSMEDFAGMSDEICDNIVHDELVSPRLFS